jgi:acyl carrier protein
MQNDEIYEKLQGIFNDLFIDEVKVRPDLSASEVDEWDSILQISLIVAVEERFKIRFGLGEVEKTRNLGDFAALIESKMVTH